MDRCQGKLTAASEGSLSGSILFCDVQALISQAVFNRSFSTEVIKKVQLCAVHLTPVHNPWPGADGLFSPEFGGVLLHTKSDCEQAQEKVKVSLQRISLAWEDLQTRPELT